MLYYLPFQLKMNKCTSGRIINYSIENSLIIRLFQLNN